jgi:hypothetical protein
MEAIENKLIRYPQYETLLGKQQALSLFSFLKKLRVERMIRGVQSLSTLPE